MDRRRLIAGNWKMNLSIAGAVSLAESVQAVALKSPNVDVALFPSFVALSSVSYALRTGVVALGAQDVFWKESGAFTGEVSPTMLVDAKCTFCIVGHSERRGRFGVADDTPSGFFSDTNETINRKVDALNYAGITPILCVGETQEERNEGRTEEVIERQLSECLDGIELNTLVIAYEPVWAIGTGAVCEPEEAEKMCSAIRNFVAHDNLRVLYGGSVMASNATAIFKQPSIDGGLVGGASLDSEEFARIVAA